MVSSCHCLLSFPHVTSFVVFGITVKCDFSPWLGQCDVFTPGSNLSLYHGCTNKRDEKIKWKYFVGFMHINVTGAEVMPWESSPWGASADCTLINGRSPPVNLYRLSRAVRIRVQELLEPIATWNNSVLPDWFVVHALSPVSVAVIYAAPWAVFGFHEDLGVCCLAGCLVRPLERCSQVFSFCAYVRLPTSMFLRESEETRLL